MKDHLHIRGEHDYSPILIPAAQGSSPHTWRTLEVRFKDNNNHGIISTYVENTRLDTKNMITDRDHLHIRGEHMLF